MPDGRPDPPPDMLIPPPRVEPVVPGLAVPPAVIAALPGATGATTGGPFAAATGSEAGVPPAGASAVPLAPITLPMVVPPSIGLGGAVAPGAPTRPTPPGAPQPNTAEPPAGREPLPADMGGSVAVPASFRVGYGEYLRTAGTLQIAALALPGVAGILVITGGGDWWGIARPRRAMRFAPAVLQGL